MTWTTTLPTKSGWYWARCDEFPEDPEVVRIDCFDSFGKFFQVVKATEGELNMSLTWRFSGPLEPPERENT
jgi:hypothetical protein